MRPAILVALISATIFTSCKKHDLSMQSTYTFRNTTNQQMNVDIYGTEQDYTNNTNRVNHYWIAPGDNVPIVFRSLDTVWVDWYSDDYSINNWGTSTDGKRFGAPLLLDAAMPISIENDNIVMGNVEQSRDTSRSVLMDGNGTSSTWEVTITPLQSPAYAGTHRFTLRKNFYGDYTFINSNGVSTTVPIYYHVTRESLIFGSSITAGFQVDIYSDDQLSESILRCSFDTQFSIVNRQTLYAYFSGPGFPQGSVLLMRK